MNVAVIIVSCIVFCIIFTILVFATTGKDATVQVQNYPIEIQGEYFKTHERVPTEPLSGR